MEWPIAIAERGWVPDEVVRAAIRRLLRGRLRSLERETRQEEARDLRRLAQEMAGSPLAIATEAANEQHYELPAEFFRLTLGPRLKYSGCFWPTGARSLAQAEELTLALTCDRAEIADGMEILELGCGWGSLSLFMAERFPAGRILAVSNSAGQKAFIDGEATRRGLTNLEVLTADMNDFDTPRRFDRVVSVEMFEHMRNWAEMLRRVGDWLASGGKLFLHVFCHRRFAYFFETEGASDWMARNFFTGGLMPSTELVRHFVDTLHVEGQWTFSGRHYQKTADAWLENLDAARHDVRPLLARVYGENQANRRLGQWRIFFMACSELFGFERGQEWLITHCLLRPGEPAAPPPIRSGYRALADF